MTIIFIIGSVLLITLFLCIMFSGIADNTDSAGTAIVFLLITLTLNALPVFMHTHDYGTIKFSDQTIEVRQQAIKDIDATLGNSFSNVPLSLLNADTPVAALVSSKQELVQEVSQARINKVSAERNIFTRCLGPSGWVCWIMGDKPK